MKVILFLFIFVSITYSCSPINKQHGYLFEDISESSDKLSQFNTDKTTKDDILSVLGSPSVQIGDINNIWIYLISIKEENVFEDDELIFQSVIRFEFDDSGILKSKEFLDENNFKKIAFSTNKTRVISNTFGITDQIYKSLIRE